MYKIMYLANMVVLEIKEMQKCLQQTKTWFFTYCGSIQTLAGVFSWNSYQKTTFHPEEMK